MDVGKVLSPVPSGKDHLLTLCAIIFWIFIVQLLSLIRNQVLPFYQYRVRIHIYSGTSVKNFLLYLYPVGKPVFYPSVDKNFEEVKIDFHQIRVGRAVSQPWFRKNPSHLPTARFGVKNESTFRKFFLWWQCPIKIALHLAVNRPLNVGLRCKNIPHCLIWQCGEDVRDIEIPKFIKNSCGCIILSCNLTNNLLS